jgi:hypothetical protein
VVSYNEIEERVTIMPAPVFRREEDVEQVKVSRPGSNGYALFRMIFDPD